MGTKFFTEVEQEFWVQFILFRGPCKLGQFPKKKYHLMQKNVLKQVIDFTIVIVIFFLKWDAKVLAMIRTPAILIAST